MTTPPKKTLPRPGRKPKNAAPAAQPSPVGANGPKQASAEESAATSRQIAILAARAGLDKKATGIEIIDVMGKVDYADYLVLMTGASDRNVAAIATAVDGDLAKAGYRSMAIEGLPAAQWVLIDFVDVVVHVFQRDVRSLYDLDGLWMDAARVPMETTSNAPGSPTRDADYDSEPTSAGPLPKARVAKSAKTTTGSKPRATSRKAPAKRAAKASTRTSTSRSASGPSRSKATRKTTRKAPRSKSSG